jgi:tryptophanyl-tRNA synthetase
LTSFRGIHIPVGEDNLQQLELARDIATTFNFAALQSLTTTGELTKNFRQQPCCSHLDQRPQGALASHPLTTAANREMLPAFQDMLLIVTSTNLLP